MVVLVEVSVVYRESPDLLIIRDSLYQPFEVLPIIETCFNEVQRFNNGGGFAEFDEPKNGFLKQSALFESEIYYALIFGGFYREENVFDPDMIQNLDSYGNTFE